VSARAAMAPSSAAVLNRGSVAPGVDDLPRDASLADGVIRLEFDSQLRARVWHVNGGGDEPHGASRALTTWAATDELVLADGRRINRFALESHDTEAASGIHGPGRTLRLRATAAAELEKVVAVTLYERYPGVAFYTVTFRNTSPRALALREWTTVAFHLLPGESAAQDATPPFWSFCGSTHEDRRDWVQPVRAGFVQDNYMGMTASDYGGGTPVVDVWRRDGGLAIGHLETRPVLLSLPLEYRDGGVSLSARDRHPRTLKPGEALQTPVLFVSAHLGDYFATLDSYRRIMSDQGLTAPSAPAAAFEPIWCAWGYERSCTLQMIEDTLPKVQELGLRWAVIDDGWQSNVGDWKLSTAKFPNGEVDLVRLLRAMRSRSLKPRLWFSPLGAVPGSDLLHDHADMLLLDKDGAPQAISWWNSFYLCPAYAKTVDYTRALVQRFIGEWGFAGLKIDGQHLDGVAPCFNPAHGHARPEESVEGLQDFLHALYQTAVAADPQAVVELCPCGTVFSFPNITAMNQTPASDPESSWQVRHKGKTLKALMGRGGSFAGDHVELSDGGDDFASTVGIGAVVSTKFTWPRDPKPKDSFLLTPQREASWRKWIALYNELMLPLGSYRGELYDIGFDRPEMHAIEKSGRLYYACYAREWRGPVPLRGLGAGRYRVRDYTNDRPLGEVTAAHDRLPVTFSGFLLLEATPA
jgi:alpha-galactosidase